MFVNLFRPPLYSAVLRFVSGSRSVLPINSPRFVSYQRSSAFHTHVRQHINGLQQTFVSAISSSRFHTDPKNDYDMEVVEEGLVRVRGGRGVGCGEGEAAAGAQEGTNSAEEE